MLNYLKIICSTLFIALLPFVGSAQGCQGCAALNSPNSALHNSCKEQNSADSKNVDSSLNTGDEFQTVGDEFESAGDDFENAGDEFESPGEEFGSSGDEFQSAGDEFGSSSDEFSNSLNGGGESSARTCAMNADSRKLNKVLLALLATIIAGFLVRNFRTRKLRPFFLIGAIVVLGFIEGACPCPISSVQNTLLFLFGEEVHWYNMLWFLGLLPVTYFLGKVWCGWICHLGALQELIHIPARFSFLQSRKAVKILKWIRIATFVLLIVQLFVTRTNIFIKYDPFKVAFNLFSTNTTGYVLLVIMLISSVLVYRPFCRGFCPIGLILGWVARIPGASVLGVKDNCMSCKSCNDACQMQAITREKKKSELDNEECIACGECLDSCRQKELRFTRKGNNHRTKVTL
jgi:NAD-dependent dihydropyrimidine dehydrogenase PreA subunit